MISVIVPIYNTAQYLDRCISSLVNQTIKDIEIILVDDGSQDASLNICQTWAKEDKRIIVIEQENSGVSAARNKGLAHAEGEYILLLDSDDWLSLNTFEVLLKEQQKCNADCVVFGLKQTSGNIWAPNKDIVYKSLEELKKDFTYWLNTELLSSSVNKLYKRELIKSYYPIGMAFGEDIFFSLDYLEQCDCIAFIKAPLYQHEVYNNASLTHTFNIKRFRDIENIQRRILEFAIDKTEDNLYEKYVSDCARIVRSYFSCDEKYKMKKQILNEWLKSSYFKGLKLTKYKLIWQNRLLLRFVQMRLYFIVNTLVNWRRFFRLS